MPVTYDADQTIQAAKTAKTVQIVGVLINVEDSKVTWKYKAFDATGKLVREAEYTETFALLLAEDANYAAVYAAVKAHGHTHYANAGLPAGGVVT